MSSLVLKLIGDEAWEHWPWRHFKSPATQARVLPTFCVIEWTYRLVAWSCLGHAVRTNGLPLWFSAWICGSFNDAAMMALPFVDNFWQAQASVMLTPRMPLYIVEMYAAIIYISTTAAHSFNLPYVSEACLTGLLAHVLYGVYDINGPPFLWWTWHDGDAAISKRQQNAPLGSSMWILTYISLHSLLLRWTETNYARLSDDLTTFGRAVLERLPQTFSTLADKTRVFTALDLLRRVQAFLNHAKVNFGALLGWALRIGFSGLVCTPLFMQAMGIFQILSLDTIGVPGQRTYKLTLAVFSALVVRGFLKAHRSGALLVPPTHTTRQANHVLLALTTFFYGVNLAVCKFGDSTKHTSTGCHQMYDVKSKVVKDVMGFLREDHIMSQGPVGPSKHDYQLIRPEEDGKPDAGGEPLVAPKAGSEWYTVRGLPRHDKDGDLRLMLKFTALGMIGYSAAFLSVFAMPSYIQ